MSEKYSTILFSDHKEFAKELHTHLEGTSFVVKGISNRADQIKTLLTHHAPDFLIIHLNQPCSYPSIHSLKISSPRTRIIITEKICHSENIFRIIQSGADSFLPMLFNREVLIQLLTNLTKDEIYLPPYVAKAILEEYQGLEQTAYEYPFILTDRERSILWCLSRGMHLEEIHTYLGISKNFLKAHLTNILQKIHFSDIVQNHFNDKLGEVKSTIEHFELI